MSPYPAGFCRGIRSYSAALLWLILLSGWLAPALRAQPTVVPGTLDLGPVAVGSTQSGFVQLRNFTGSPLAVTSIQPPVAPFAQIGSNCAPLPITLPNLGTCTLTYEFAPTSPGLFAQALDVHWQDGLGNSGTVQVLLEGEGIGPALSIVPNPLDFGLIRVGVTSPPMLVTLGSAGAVTLDVTSIQSAAAPFAFTAGGSCPSPPFSLAPAATCTLALEFQPQIVGPVIQSIQIQTNAGVDFLDLTGTGGAPDIALLPVAVQLPDTGVGAVSSPTSMHVLNAGAFPLTVTGLNALVPLGPEFQLQSGSCGPFPFQVPAGGSCELLWIFAPSATGMLQRGGNLISDALTGSGAFTLQGTGLDLQLSLGPAVLDFGSWYAGETSAPMEVTLINAGTDTLAVGFANAVIPMGNPFVLQAGSCPDPVVLPPAASCFRRYVFAPGVAGSFSLVVEAISGAPTSPDIYTVTGIALDPTIFSDGFEP
ncbi:MAG: hypothetical protein Kow0020_15280 [Wenzhouxiangellaceae bacterium]